RHEAHVVHVEATAFQLAFVQLLRQQGLLVRELKADRDKEARMMTAAPAFQQGHVYFPRDATWLSTYIDEILQFPDAAYDDQADVSAYGVGYLRRSQVATRMPSGSAARVSSFPKGWALNEPPRL